MKARDLLRAFLVWKLPPRWHVGRTWKRGTLRCTGPDGAVLQLEDFNDPDGRWHGFSLLVEEGALCEYGGDHYRAGFRGGWPAWVADEALAAVARIGTRKRCPTCNGYGIEASAPDYACARCRGAGTVPVGET